MAKLVQSWLTEASLSFIRINSETPDRQYVRVSVTKSAHIKRAYGFFDVFTQEHRNAINNRAHDAKSNESRAARRSWGSVNYSYAQSIKFWVK
jgi:hypothetical protein